MQIEEELAALQKERTEKVKNLFERQERELETFDVESSRMGFGSLASFDFPKEDDRWSNPGWWGHLMLMSVDMLCLYYTVTLGFSKITFPVTMLELSFKILISGWGNFWNWNVICSQHKWLNGAQKAKELNLEEQTFSPCRQPTFGIKISNSGYFSTSKHFDMYKYEPNM